MSVVLSQAHNIMSLSERESNELGFRILEVKQAGAINVGILGDQFCVQICLASYPGVGARQVIYDVLGFCWDCHGLGGLSLGSPPVLRLYFIPPRGICTLRTCGHYDGLPGVIERLGFKRGRLGDRL